MPENRFLDAVREGRHPLQASMWTPSVLYAEVIARSGYEGVCLDMQHGPISESDVFGLSVVLSAYGVTPCVRIPRNDRALIGRLLDAGVYGVICPDVRTAEEARAFADACRYPPRGTRGFGPSRPQLSGGGGSSPFSIDAENDTIMAIVQIESGEGLENAEEILSTPGVDSVFPGMVDFALDVHGELIANFLDERVLSPLERIVSVARSAGVSVGLAAIDTHEVPALLEIGADWLNVGNDRRWIVGGAQRTSAEARKAIDDFKSRED
jgi:4-hydroxy-2-oxoheptanedioate aldolase